MKNVSRRQVIQLGLAAPLIPLVAGCRATLPSWSVPASTNEAFALLKESANTHGLASYGAITDINVSYSGHWRRLVQVLQPALVDAGFRGGSEERLMLRDGLIAQSHHGPKGHKQVIWVNNPGEGSSIHVWFNGEEAHDRDRLDAAALVAEAYALFLLGPILLIVNENPRRDIHAALAGTEQVKQGKQTHLCDVVNMQVSPGFGNCDSDQLAVYISRASRLMLKVRMTINGLESTRGALVDIDTSEHRSIHGILWPTAFHERLLRPAPLDVHHWRLTGLDINRGESRAELNGPDFTGSAALPAATLTSV